ncbi:MAG TPA: endonuclease VII domain-containing protein [Methylomirabilota bacterium]|nr:endonuclease VII domain-containing protein [Methylomirabilota bacterium]
MKWCNRCKRYKHKEEFHRSRNAPDGLSYICKVCNRNYRIAATYDLTPDDYDQMLEDQNYSCSICKKETKDRNLAIDHHHGSGVVRSLLCTNCNSVIGFALEDPEILENAAAYIRLWGEIIDTIHLT